MIPRFVEVDKAWLRLENKRLFDIDVCPTCQSQLFEAYVRLKTYLKNEDEMAKQKENPISGTYKLKEEFIGSTHADGKVCIILSDVQPNEVEALFTPDQIETYIEKQVN
jgi:hypothetical protein